MSFSSACIQWEAKQKEKVMEDTWGHLVPKKNHTYHGYIVFCWASNGDLTPIDYDFTDLPGSPWLLTAIIDFIGDNAKQQCKVYRFDGTFRNYVFKGIVKEVPV